MSPHQKQHLIDKRYMGPATEALRNTGKPWPSDMGETCSEVAPRPKNSEVEDALHILNNVVVSLDKAISELNERIQRICVFMPQPKDDSCKEPPQPTRCAVANVLESKIQHITHLDHKIQELLNSIRL